MLRRSFLERLPGLTALARGATSTRSAAGDEDAHVADVRALGAVGDGRADDSPAFDRAIARAAERGVPVRVPAGTYRLTRTVDARDISGFAIRGDAMAASRLFLDSPERELPLLAVGQRTSARGTHTVHDVTVRDLHLANARHPGRGVGIEVNDSARTALENLKLDYLFDAIRVPSGRWIHKARISNVIAERNAGCALRAEGDPAARTLFSIVCLNVKFEHNGAHGILFGHGSDLVVSGFSHVGGNALDGVHLVGSDRVRVQSAVLEAVDIDGNRGHNLFASRAEWLSISDVWVGGAGGQGVARTELPEAQVAERAGILLDDVRSSVLTNVRAVNNSNVGIRIRDCWGVTLAQSVALGNGRITAGSNAGGVGVLVEGRTASFVTLVGVNVSPAPGDWRQDVGLWLAGELPHHVVLHACVGYNNAVRNLRVDAPSQLRSHGCDFGDA